ncbi:MAG: tetratricopeptide repeat protein [Pseudomonadota bacterium]
MTAAGNARPSDVDRILADAATTLREGRVDEAIAKVRDGMAVHHDDARLGAQHAKLMMENGAFQAGFNQLKTLAQKSDAPLETLFLFGQSLQSAGRGNALERLFRRIERQAPHHPRLYVMRAVHFEKLGRWDEACRVAQEGLKHHPNSSGLITRLAHATAASGRGEDAIRLLENAPPKAATSLNVLSTLFDIYVSEHRVEDAGGVTKTLQGTFPDEPVTSLKSQEFLALTGDFEAALRCCDSGLATHPASVPLALAKVQRLKDLGRNSAAMDFLRGTIRGGIKAPQVRLALARLLQDAGELTKARAILAAFGRSPPIPAILAKASLLRVGGDIGAAAALLRSELEARPQERGIAVELVYALLEMGDVAAAEKVLRSNEALQEDTHSALLLQAAVCVAKGDLESAATSLAGVLAGPTPDENRLVSLLEQVGDVDGVKAVLARVEGRPPTVANLIKVARLSVLLEEDDQAVKALDRAAKIAGDAVEVRISKASVLSQMGYIFEATDTLKALPKDILADPSLRRVRAKCFWAVGEREAGLAALREAAASGDARSVYQLVRALVDLGRLDEARGEAGKVRQSNRTAASLVSLCRAVIALAALDLDRAAQHGQDAVDEDPSSAEALRILTSIEVTRLESARAWTALETLERHRKFRKVVASVALSRARLTIFGQMLNEFDLHPQVTERARDLLRAPPGDGVDGLKVEVAHEPGHTGVAIAYLIAPLKTPESIAWVSGAVFCGSCRKMP